MYINKLFPLPIHPFNLQNTGEKNYAMWQFEKGFNTIKFYLPYTTVEEIFKETCTVFLKQDGYINQ